MRRIEPRTAKTLKDADETKESGNDARPPECGSAGKPNPNTSKKQVCRKKEKHVKVSNRDPESGWFHKEAHKSVFTH